ncbi:MAG: cytochrome c oxidase subunit [Bryobacterales bacterium]|jgi:cytochrome c oxidase subunit 2|nr:cytochrome c oxidase subunit [Bryobacterales bacterium]
MMQAKSFELFPEAASTIAGQVDALYAFLILVSAFFSLLIAFLVVYFAYKYRARPGVPFNPEPHDDHSAGGMILEIVWTAIPLGLSMIMFVWGVSIYFTESRPPADSMEVYVTGKQWMWKIQHMEGAREINELHIPVGRNIKLTMTSEDVIHDFSVPAFRTKSDVLPGKYTTEWFQATKVGQYHIFCAEYCGTKHSGMVGTVYVMSQADYNTWLGAGSGEGSMAEQGQSLFNQLGCGNCHASVVNNQNGRCPNLVGLFGSRVDLKGGTSVRADESYIRESILYPQSKIVAGYEDYMPTFKGLITEDGLLKLIEYVKSLGAKNGTQNTATSMPVQTGPVPQESGRAAGLNAFGNQAARTGQNSGATANRPPQGNR